MQGNIDKRGKNECSEGASDVCQRDIGWSMYIERDIRWSTSLNGCVLGYLVTQNSEVLRESVTESVK